MSDFLTRLAERALGLAPLAKPWIAFRFAQGPDLAAEGPGPLPPEPVRVAPPPMPEMEEDPAVWRRLLEPPQEAVTAPPARTVPPVPASRPGTVRLLSPSPAPAGPRPLRPPFGPPAAPAASPQPAPEPAADGPRPCPTLQSYLRRPQGGAP